MGAVRTRLHEENERAVAEGRAVMPEASVMKMAEDLLPTLRVAEWRDRAEAAKAQAAELDLRDLRSVVAASGDPMVARDETTRALADELKHVLATKQEQELQFWYGDIDAALAVGRVIRALATVVAAAQGRSPVPARHRATPRRQHEHLADADGCAGSLGGNARGGGVLPDPRAGTAGT